MTPEHALRRTLALWGVATVALVIILMQWADLPIATYFYGHRGTAFVAFFAAITDFANGAIWYSLALIGILVAAYRYSNKAKNPDPVRLRKHIRAWLFMAATMASTGILINIMKFVIGRERPRFYLADGLVEFHPLGLRIADSSFPSGHTQSIWTAMLSLSFIFPPLRPAFLIIAVVIGLSRIVVNAHYLSDVVMSIFIAVAATLLWRQWFQKDGISVTLADRRPRANRA